VWNGSRPRPVTVLGVVRVYVLSRLVVVAGAVFAAVALHDPGTGPWPRLPAPHVGVLRALGRWDGAWYLDIAGHGYRHVSNPIGRDAIYAFFPLFAWVVRGVSWLTFSPSLITGLTLAVVFGGVATVLVYHLVADACGPVVGRRAAALFCFFPGAFVLSMTYAESLMLAAVTGSLFAYTRRRWVTAGLLGAVAVTTRPNAAMLVVAFAWCAVVALRRGETRRQLVVPALTAAGLVFVIAYEWATTGHLFEWLRVENRTWGDHFGVSVQSAHRFIDFVTSGPLGLHQGQLNDFVWAGGWVLGLIGACVLVRTGLPLVLKVYGVAAFAFACLSYNVGPRPRLLLSAFPVVIAFAVIARGRAFRGLLFASAVGLVALSVVTFATVAAVP
jgi:Mannosyltransferase (PIG-V)